MKKSTGRESKTADKLSTRIRKDAKNVDDGEKPPVKKRLGILKDSGIKLTEAFWEPLPEEELKLWEGEDE